MIRYKPDRGIRTVIFLLALLSPCCAEAAAIAPECRPLEIAEGGFPAQIPYGEGLLWEVRQNGMKPSYVFGTIHVSDPDITRLPDKVNSIFTRAGLFTLEALPEPDQIMLLTSMMFLDDGTQLSGLVSPTMYERAIEILAGYQIPREAATVMKPWAAFLVMNYPPGNDLPMDLKLLFQAQQQGMTTYGLETLAEQGKIFDEMAQDKQLRLLIDTVCHYDQLQEDFGKMKSLYLERDLKGMYELSGRYNISGEAVYQELMKKLLTDRNVTMVESMQHVLLEGDAFIAIGALHLAGDDGVLSLLAKKGYEIKLIY